MASGWDRTLPRSADAPRLKAGRPGAGGLLAVPAVIGGMVSFQCGASLAKSLFPVFGAFATVGLRIGIAAVVLCVVWRPWRAPLGREAALAVLLYGAALAAMNTCFYQAIARLPLGVTVAIEFVGPLGVALAGSRRWRDLGWLALVLAGLVLLLGPGAGARRLDPVGLGFAALSAFGWAAYIVCGMRLGRLMPAGRATTLGMLAAACLVVPAGIGAMRPLLHAPELHALRLAAAAFGVAMLSSALPYTLELAAMRRMSARGFGILMSLDPAIAALLGVVLLGERLAPGRWVGILCIVAASAGSVLFGEAAAELAPDLAAAPAVSGGG